MTSLRRWSRRFSGVSAVAAALVGLIALVAVTAAWQVSETRHTRRALVLEGNLTSARISAQAVGLALESRLKLVEGIAQRSDFQQIVANKDWDGTVVFLQGIRGVDPEIGSAAVLDAEGRLWARDPADPSIVGTSFLTRNYLQGALATNGPYLSEVFVQKGTAQATVVAFASAVRDSMDRIVGVVQATLPISVFETLTEAIDVPNQGSIQVFDQSDHALTGRAAGPDRKFKTSPPVARAMRGEYGAGEFRVPGLSGTRLVAFAPVPGAGWSVLVEQPPSVALDPVGGLIWRLSGIVALVLLIALLSGLLVGRLLRQLAREGQRVNAVLGSAMDCIISMDHHGNITEFNPAAERTFGYARRDVLGKPLADMIIPPSLRDSHRRGLAKYLATGEGPVLGKVLELQGMRADGTEFPVELSITRLEAPGPPSFTGILRDITTRKQAEEALRDSEARKTAILSSIADGVVTVDPEKRILSINSAMEHLSGWHLEEVLGRPYFEVFPLFDERGELLGPERRSLTKAIESGRVESSRGYGLMLMTRDGRRMPVGVAGAPVLDQRGELLGGVGIVRDVSHEREVDQMKSALISTVSHELRTPLTMIQGFSELLLERDLSEKQSREALERINGSAERLSRMIENLLSVSRIESGRIVPRTGPVDLSEVVQEVVGFFAHRDGREFHADLEERLPVLVADRDMLVQILTNLVSNAAKYSPPEAPVMLRAKRNGRALEISITDQGIGLTEREAEQLFEKFYRADRSEVREAGGTGLGLYITKHLVEIQGGQIWVRSTPGRGSTFAFSLPVAAEDKEEVVP